MRISLRVQSVLWLALVLPLILSCSNSLSSGNDALADDQVAASMSSTEAGATYATAADLTQTTTGSAASGTQTSGSIVVVIDPPTFQVSYYSGLNGAGTYLGSTP
ncbi:MAG TPA: hypothetical protein VMC79_07720, partial [Rectinemataceae bacterium]|nr:hypothetical protein [Rectinemataceae bacterium]